MTYDYVSANYSISGLLNQTNYLILIILPNTSTMKEKLLICLLKQIKFFLVQKGEHILLTHKKLIHLIQSRG